MFGSTATTARIAAALVALSAGPALHPSGASAYVKTTTTTAPATTTTTQATTTTTTTTTPATTTTTVAGSYNPSTDPYSMAALTANIGATAWWNAGYTGAGIDVALIDTGVSPIEGLGDSGKIINGPDLSLESQAPNLTRLDTNGHGTFMAGLIAGKDSTLTAPYANAADSAYRGVAPDARIVSLKVGTADGGVDVSQMIAAIDWVVQHKNDNGMNIRVLNLLVRRLLVRSILELSAVGVAVAR